MFLDKQVQLGIEQAGRLIVMGHGSGAPGSLSEYGREA
jgi:hypothetical protein